MAVLPRLLQLPCCTADGQLSAFYAVSLVAVEAVIMVLSGVFFHRSVGGRRLLPWETVIGPSLLRSVRTARSFAWLGISARSLRTSSVACRPRVAVSAGWRRQRPPRHDSNRRYYGYRNLMLLAHCRLRMDFCLFHVNLIASLERAAESFRPQRVPLMRDYRRGMLDIGSALRLPLGSLSVRRPVCAPF